MEHVHHAVSVYVTKRGGSWALWKVKLPSDALPAVSHLMQTRDKHTCSQFHTFFFFFRNEGIKFSNWRLSLKCRQMESNGDGRTGKLSLPHLKASDVVLSSRIVFPTQRPGHSLYDPWLKPFQCYWQCRARVTQHLMQCINKIIRTTF